MKIVEITDPLPARPMTTYWHITRHTRLPSILQQGILPKRRRQWTNSMGGRLGRTGMVYLFSDFDAAIQLAHRLEWGLRSTKSGGVDILELTTNVAVEPDPSAEAQVGGAGKWWMTSEAIPASAIKRVIPLTLEIKRDFIARRDGRPPPSQVQNDGEDAPE